MSFQEAADYTIRLFNLKESTEDIVREWNEMAQYEYTHNVKLAPYALDYLMKLKHLNIKIAVATGLPEKLYKPCLIHNHIYEMFDALCSTEQVGRGKEYSDVFLFAAKCLEIPPEKCLVFEDVLPAVKSAKQAGMTVCGVYNKYFAYQKAQIMNIADSYLYSFKNAPLPKGRNND
jgi:HAD superfamily hydrolase (TIGR01509 family)